MLVRPRVFSIAFSLLAISIAGAIVAPNTLAADTTNPNISMPRLSSTSPCVYVPPGAGNLAWIRSRDCSGTYEVEVTAFDPWQDTVPSNTSGLGTGAEPGSYGIQWPASSSALNITTSNWTSTIHREAGAPTGLRTRCWGTHTFSGPFGDAIDPQVNYDSGRYGTSMGFRNAETSEAGHPPRTAFPGTSDMSCTWAGYLLPRGTALGSYGFKLFSDERGRLDVGAPGASHSTPSGCLGSPVPTVCNWTNHAPTWDGPGTISITDRLDVRPITVAWSDRGGEAVTAVIWDPPNAPTLASAITTGISAPAQPNYEVVPSSAYVTDASYSRTYSFTADVTDQTSGIFSHTVVARDQASRMGTSLWMVAPDNSVPPLPHTLVASAGPTSGAPGTATVHMSKRDADDLESGLASIRVEHTVANRTAGVCAATIAAPQVIATGWTIDSATTQEFDLQVGPGCHFLEYVATDRVGNERRTPLFTGTTKAAVASWWSFDGVPPTPDPGAGTGVGGTPTPVPPRGTTQPGGTTPVTNRAPVVRIISLAPITRDLKKKVPVKWIGRDPDGDTLTYTVQIASTHFGGVLGAWRTYASGLTASTTNAHWMSTGNVVCYRVVAIDVWGVKSAASSQTCHTTPHDDLNTWGPGWTRIYSDRGAYRGSVSELPRTGFLLRVRGNVAYIVLRTCASCGRVEVLRDGKVVARVTTRHAARSAASTVRVTVPLGGVARQRTLAVRGVAGAKVWYDAIELDR
ncbi:MAG: hypothetical protein JWM90_2745 [Thermoleophilia bacterium]|nr:hypothetical protein [Thermoleophilia bacterium]